MRGARAVTALGVTTMLAVSGCTSNSAGDGKKSEGGTIDVASSDDACSLSATKVGSGNVVFKVKNTGSKVTEFYLLASDGLRVVGEVENIAPGLTRELVLKAEPGSYKTACKPGMVGQGQRAAFTVTDSGADLGASGGDKVLADRASTSYGSYVKDQTGQLLTKTTQFVNLYKKGDVAGAKALYAPTRVHWERVETVAESFGDLDPKMDLREADLEPGQKWTGWHRIEKDLWSPAGYTKMSSTQRTAIADQLLRDTRTLYSRTRTGKYSVTSIANGSKGLLDEVATGKVTGEEEKWSHTDLFDFQANVDGAKVAFETLRPILKKKKDTTLENSISTKFGSLQKLLDQHRRGPGFVSYDQLSTTQVKDLSRAVNALSEPLSKLTAAVTL